MNAKIHFIQSFCLTLYFYKALCIYKIHMLSNAGIDLFMHILLKIALPGLCKNQIGKDKKPLCISIQTSHTSKLIKWGCCTAYLGSNTDEILDKI